MNETKKYAIMKTKITLLTAMLLIGFSSVFASIPSLDGTKVDARQEIKVSIDYPDFAIEQGLEGVVYVRLEVLDNGKVNILNASSLSNDLLRYVVDNIEAMYFDPAIYITGQPFNLKFSFLLL